MLARRRGARSGTDIGVAAAGDELITHSPTAHERWATCGDPGGTARRPLRVSPFAKE
jgi:hypothetical protein